MFPSEDSEQGASPNPSAALVCLLWFACYYPSELFWSVCLMRMKTTGRQQPPGEKTHSWLVTPLLFYFTNHFPSHVLLPPSWWFGPFLFLSCFPSCCFSSSLCFFILCDQKFLSVNSPLHTFDVTRLWQHVHRSRLMNNKHDVSLIHDKITTNTSVCTLQKYVLFS